MNYPDGCLVLYLRAGTAHQAPRTVGLVVGLADCTSHLGSHRDCLDSMVRWEAHYGLDSNYDGMNYDFGGLREVDSCAGDRVAMSCSQA